LNLAPKLQIQDNFKDAVSKLTRELALNRKFVSSSPQRPALGSKEGPQEPSGFIRQGIQDVNPFMP
jgi:hypothetical protein